MRIFEINTWPWLSELSQRYGRALTLSTVPEAEWDAIGALHVDAVWLMGIWRRSPAGREIALRTDGVVRDCAAALPAFAPARDIVGSPYCIQAYSADEHLGGTQGLDAARQKLKDRGLELILDFVPNHTAPDHPWLQSDPTAYLPGTEDEAGAQPLRFFRRGRSVFAFGAPSSDPGSVWRDTVQLNAFSERYRELSVETLASIGEHCDGVRCDMAYLLQTAVFAGNWGPRAGAAPATEYWTAVLERVRARRPGMFFIAESYCNSEASLIQQGFTYCYDKDRFYDRLRAADVQGLRLHLQGAGPRKDLLRFIENHDEPPVVEAFTPPAKHRMAAVALATVPGASLYHYLQLEGRWGKQQVQLGTQVSVRSFYQRLLSVTDRPAIREGTWAMCPVTEAPSMIAYCWEHGEDRLLVVLNLSEDERTWGGVTLPWPALRGHSWSFRDLLSEDTHTHDGDDMLGGRLYVRPRAWGADLFEVKRAE